MVFRAQDVVAVLRVERHCANALAVARYLESVPCLKRVLPPGLTARRTTSW